MKAIYFSSSKGKVVRKSHSQPKKRIHLTPVSSEEIKTNRRKAYDYLLD